MQYDYDLFVIGAGSGGVRAARLAGATGARVGIAEQVQIGGTCVLRGCVPKKLLVYGSEFSQAFRDAKGFGWALQPPQFDWPTLRDAVQAETNRLSGIYTANLAKAKVETFDSRAIVVDPHRVRLKAGDKEFTTERILIATGGRTYRPENTPGQELGITSTEAFTLAGLPNKILIAGGGYIAVEFATIFSGLGVDTTVIYRGDGILRGFDADARAHVQADLQRTGVKFMFNATISDLKDAAGRISAMLSDGSTLTTDQVMWAVGRVPNTMNMGLEAAGVRLTERGAVAVDEFSRTNVPSVWAVGDVTDRLNLTPVAIREAQAFAATEFKNSPTAFDHADVASAVFSRPPLGAVGLTEEQARKQAPVKIFRTTFRPMKHILAGNQQRVLMKMVVCAESDRVLGIHIAGADAPDLIQLAAIAVKAKLTKAQWDETCAVHPTGAEELVLMGEPIAHNNEAPA